MLASGVVTPCQKSPNQEDGMFRHNEKIHFNRNLCYSWLSHDDLALQEKVKPYLIITQLFFPGRGIMSSPFDLAQVDKIGSQAREYFFQHVLSWAMAVQIIVIGCALLLARKVSGGMRAWVIRQQGQYPRIQKLAPTWPYSRISSRSSMPLSPLSCWRLPIIFRAITTGPPRNCVSLALF